MKVILVLLCASLVGCVTKPKANTQVPSLKYAKSYVVDAKDFNSRASKTNTEIDDELKKLLMETPE